MEPLRISSKGKKQYYSCPAKGAQTKTQLLKAFKHVASMISKKLHIATASLSKGWKQKPGAQIVFRNTVLSSHNGIIICCCLHSSICLEGWRLFYGKKILENQPSPFYQKSQQRHHTHKVDSQSSFALPHLHSKRFWSGSLAPPRHLIWKSNEVKRY